MHDRRETKVTVPMGKATKTIPPFNPGIFGGGHIPPDHVEYTTPTYFLGFQKTWGGVLRMSNFFLDISGYIRWIYIDQKSKPRMTSANFYSWSLKILRKSYFYSGSFLRGVF